MNAPMSSIARPSASCPTLSDGSGTTAINGLCCSWLINAPCPTPVISGPRFRRALHRGTGKLLTHPDTPRKDQEPAPQRKGDGLKVWPCQQPELALAGVRHDRRSNLYSLHHSTQRVRTAQRH